MPFAALQQDMHVTAQVRLRRWLYRGPRTSWPSTAHSTVIELAWVRSGAISYRVGQRELTVEHDAMIMVPAGVEHATTFECDASATSLHLALEMTAEIACSMEGNMASDVVVLPASKRLSVLVELLESEAGSGAPGSLLATDAIAEALAVELLRAQSSAKGIVRRTTDTRIRAALHKIECDYADPLTIDQLAGTARMSRFHFSRAFQAQTGKSPYRYLLETRIARAAEILRSGRATVTEAAMTVGFPDLGRFSRMFREKMGTSPGTYAAERRSRAVQRSCTE
jgi:AraC-like DNA-binding protein